jgi:RES domain
VSGPLPPPDLNSREPELVEIPKGTIIHRFYSAAYDPIYFDKSQQGRFNAPDQSYGVLYTAENPAGAFAETFLRTPGRTLIDSDLLDRKAYVRLSVTRSLRLIRMAGPGLARLGATAEVTHSGLPYDVPQSWSKALASHPVNVDGIAYFSRHDDDELCHALFDATEGAIREVARETNLDHDWFWSLAEQYGVGFAP